MIRLVTQLTPKSEGSEAPDAPPFVSMLGGYAIVFLAVLLLPLLFFVVRLFVM